MNELVKQEKIENMIYEIRGVQVMLDSDLAILYAIETKRINEAVRRNNDKFPERFPGYCLIVKVNFFWSQIAIIKLKRVVENIKILEFLQNKE